MKIYLENENQRKIVKILDKVSDVIEKKEQELEQLETLVKSRFVAPLLG